MLLDDGYYEDSIKVIKQALFRKTPRDSEKKQAIDHVPLAIQLWQLYIDLERNFGTFSTVRAAYKRMMELKVITPFILMNYAQMLEDNQYFEESFKVFEYGISLFQWPNVHEIWYPITLLSI